MSFALYHYVDPNTMSPETNKITLFKHTATEIDGYVLDMPIEAALEAFGDDVDITSTLSEIGEAIKAAICFGMKHDSIISILKAVTQLNFGSAERIVTKIVTDDCPPDYIHALIQLLTSCMYYVQCAEPMTYVKYCEVLDMIPIKWESFHRDAKYYEHVLNVFKIIDEYISRI